MKRLRKKLLAMETNTKTYAEMYKGTIIVVDPDDYKPPEAEEDPVYYKGDIGYEITVSHKLAKDKPTITVMIPEKMILQDKPDEGCAEAVADFCLREFKHYIDELNAGLYNRSRPDEENGRYYLGSFGGEVLKRNTAYFALCRQRDYRYGSGETVYLLKDDVPRPSRACLCLKLQVQLPRGKLRKTLQMLCCDLPDAVERFLAEFDAAGLQRAISLAQRQADIRAWLKNSDYCAFVANGSILPRLSGTDLPMPGAVPFLSVPQDEIEVCGIRGMGIRKGVTVITGGGYSGKSTLLDAISAGIYNHIPGDGRELCITDETAVTISAEDGRSVKHVNISPFVRWLPGGDAGDFSTEHASGSTSQAANIMEAVDGGAKLLLIDEDRSATNFMIRDRMMKELITKEPLIPFTDRAGELAGSPGVSTILVIGGSGEYLEVADKVYMMEDYLIRDMTEKSKEICRKHGVRSQLPQAARWLQRRVLQAEGFTSYPEGQGSEKLMVSDMGFLLIGDEQIDLRGLHDLVSSEQITALGFMLRYLEIKNSDLEIELCKKVDELYGRIEAEGLDFLYSSYFTTCARFLALPRRQELLALVNRMRRIHFENSNLEKAK